MTTPVEHERDLTARGQRLHGRQVLELLQAGPAPAHESGRVLDLVRRDPVEREIDRSRAVRDLLPGHALEESEPAPGPGVVGTERCGLSRVGRAVQVLEGSLRDDEDLAHSRPGEVALGDELLERRLGLGGFDEGVAQEVQRLLEVARREDLPPGRGAHGLDRARQREMELYQPHPRREAVDQHLGLRDRRGTRHQPRLGRSRGARGEEDDRAQEEQGPRAW